MSCHSAASGFVASAFSSALVFGLALIFRSSKSCRSRTLLRKICSLPGRYCGGQNTASAPYQAAAFSVNDGSTRCGGAGGPRTARAGGGGGVACAAGGEDGIDLIGRRDVADAHGGDARLVADLVGERRLEHASVDRLGVAHR